MENPLVYSNDITVKPGDYIDVPVLFKNNVGIIKNNYIKLKYDFSVFDSYEIIENGDVSVDFSTVDTTDSSLLIFMNGLGDELDSGKLFTVRFHVSDTKVGDYSIGLSISNNKWKTDNISVEIRKEQANIIMNADGTTGRLGD